MPFLTLGRKYLTEYVFLASSISLLVYNLFLFTKPVVLAFSYFSMTIRFRFSLTDDTPCPWATLRRSSMISVFINGAICTRGISPKFLLKLACCPMTARLLTRSKDCLLWRFRWLGSNLRLLSFSRDEFRSSRILPTSLLSASPCVTRLSILGRLPRTGVLEFR